FRARSTASGSNARRASTSASPLLGAAARARASLRATDHVAQAPTPTASANPSTGSERIARDRLLDTLEERLLELRERQIRLNPADVDGRDRLLNATDDRDLADRDDTTFLTVRVCCGAGEEERCEDRRSERACEH